MLRTRLILIAGALSTACGFDTAGDGESGTTGSSSSEGGDATMTGPTTTAPTTSVTMTTGPDTDATTTESTTAGTADTSTETSTTQDPDSSGSESTGEPDGWGPFEDITPIAEISDMFAADDDPTLTGDMLEIYFNSNRLGQEDIFVSRRQSVDDPFEVPVVVLELTTPFFDTVPELSHDGLVMTLSNNTAGGAGGFDAFISTREDTESLWSVPVRIDEINTADGDGALSMTDDMLTAVLCRSFPAQMDFQLMGTTRQSTDDAWDEPVIIDALLSDGRDCSPWLTADGSELWFGSSRPDLGEDENIYRVTMNGIEPDGDIEEITELTTDSDDDDPWLSPDGAVIVFSSNRDGQVDIYTARREPV